jgi:hypothetical protein
MGVVVEDSLLNRQEVLSLAVSTGHAVASSRTATRISHVTLAALAGDQALGRFAPTERSSLRKVSVTLGRSA